MDSESSYNLRRIIERRAWVDRIPSSNSSSRRNLVSSLGQARLSSSHPVRNGHGATDVSFGFDRPTIVFLFVAIVCLSFVLVPTGFSPVGVSAAQATDQHPGQGQTQNQSTPSINITNQTTNGSVVTVQSVTLSQPGYVALHTSSYADDLVGPSVSVIAVSDRLSAGTHRNVTINISHAPAGNAPGLNQSQLKETQTLVAAVYADSNSNQRYDYVYSFGEVDTLVRTNSDPVQEAARVRVPQPKPTTASVSFRNQTIYNNTITVARARLPDGGFLVAQNASYQRTEDALTSSVGISKYLPPGSYTNVSITLLSESINDTQTVTIRPSRDTNDNQEYDFIQSNGFQDVAYETVNHSAIITDSAVVFVPGSSRSPQTQTVTATTAASPTTPTATAVPATASGERDRSDGFLGLGFGLDLGEIMVILALLMGGIYLIQRIRSP